MSYASYRVFRPRRSTKIEWETYNPILLEGEMGVETPDAGTGKGLVKVKFGDGITPWNNLPYALDTNAASSIHGGSAETGYPVCLRADINANWMRLDPVLELGELVLDITSMNLKVGDGHSRYSQLSYVGQSNEFDFEFGDEDQNPTHYDYDEDMGQETNP